MKSHARQPGGWRTRWKDFAIYVAISIALVAVLSAGEIRHPSWFDWKWIAFALNTGVFCGFVVHCFRKVWRLQKFWQIFFSLLLLHSLGFIALLRAVEDFPLIWYALLVPLELQASITVYRRFNIYPER